MPRSIDKCRSGEGRWCLEGGKVEPEPVRDVLPLGGPENDRATPLVTIEADGNELPRLVGCEASDGGIRNVEVFLLEPPVLDDEVDGDEAQREGTSGGDEGGEAEGEAETPASTERIDMLAYDSQADADRARGIGRTSSLA